MNECNEKKIPLSNSVSYHTKHIYLIKLAGSQGRTYKVSPLLESGSQIEGPIGDSIYPYILPGPKPGLPIMNHHQSSPSSTREM